MSLQRGMGFLPWMQSLEPGKKVMQKREGGAGGGGGGGEGVGAGGDGAWEGAGGAGVGGASASLTENNGGLPI